MSQIKMIRNASRVLAGVASRLERSDVVVSHLTGPWNSRNMSSKAVTLENVNPNIVKLEYAVRGPLVIRAAEIEKELEKVLACVSYPPLIDTAGFPEDVKQRAREILGACGGQSVGSYSASHGIELIRRRVAEYIERRDGHPAHWEDICLSGGASNAIKNCLQLLCNDIDGKTSGVLIPIPQYPLYSASLAEYGLAQVGYYLDEDNNWGLDVKELERAIADADCNVRALVVINPGNPTGQVLTRQNIEEVIKFAHKHKLFLFADEVYQENVYAEGSQFFAFKKVLREVGAPYDTIELASYMSASKGYVGECGARPPQKGEPSYELFMKEKTQVLASLKQRAELVADSFNQMKGFKCNVVQPELLKEMLDIFKQFHEKFTKQYS
ncbi:Alanine aminotransferase [Operophtera brumata]|uniref:alanine transaminase n=1 Tax=Operophtera brumata TaxID=104452 RepID=A0A0L7LBQ1_OPEBR|nr:Alanine aminotransferase [Operophtera brumata]